MEKKSIAIVAAGISALMPQGKRERIVGYYNPETDKPQGRNESCRCGSGLKFKKCHGTPSRNLALPIDGKEVETLTCGYCDSKFSKGTGGNYGEYGEVCINCYEGLS